MNNLSITKYINLFDKTKNIDVLYIIVGLLKNNVQVVSLNKYINSVHKNKDDTKDLFSKIEAGINGGFIVNVENYFDILKHIQSFHPENDSVNICLIRSFINNNINHHYDELIENNKHIKNTQKNYYRCIYLLYTDRIIECYEYYIKNLHNQNIVYINLLLHILSKLDTKNDEERYIEEKLYKLLNTFYTQLSVEQKELLFSFNPELCSDAIIESLNIDNNKICLYINKFIEINKIDIVDKILRRYYDKFPQQSIDYLKIISNISQKSFYISLNNILDFEDKYKIILHDQFMYLMNKFIENRNPKQEHVIFAKSLYLCDKIIANKSKISDKQLEDILILKFNILLLQGKTKKAKTLLYKTISNTLDSNIVRYLTIDILCRSQEYDKALKLCYEIINDHEKEIKSAYLHLFFICFMHTKKYTEIYDIFINMEWYKNLSINLANLIVKLSGYIDKHHEIFNLIQGIKDKNYAHQYILECIAEILFNDTGDTKYISYISENRQYRIDISRYVRGKQGILYCADNNFFTAGLVSLTSFILENKYLLPSVKIFFTIDKTISEKNINKIKILCQQFNVDYEIIDAENILDSTNLKVEYGIFSSGKILAASAYYRIYAIKYILNAHNLDKLLYVDCDTLFVSDIYDLFSIDTKYPLIAKTDLPSPPVVHSKKINNIQNYFNSGVLLLNMQHEQIAYFINNAIKNISSYNNLIMHDQCALNIAFDGNYKELDDKYNFYLFPWAEVPIKNAKILHLLDSPKPWDSIYRYNIKITEQWFKIKNILETLIYTNDQ